MTRYTITWRQAALDHLARIWTDSPDRPAVTRAADAIDVELRRQCYCGEDINIDRVAAYAMVKLLDWFDNHTEQPKVMH